EVEASPARPPAISMTQIQDRDTLMPALRAAFAFAPTLRNSNPIVLRFSSHHTPTAQARASRKLALTRRGEPRSSGRCASLWISGLTRSVRPGRCIAEVPRIQDRKYAIT